MNNNPNRQFFRSEYPKHWLARRDARVADRSHYHYQQIALESLDCYSGCTIFECGCGSGELLARLAGNYKNIQIVGIDLGRDSLLWGKRKILANYSPDFIEGDLISLPVKDNSFDRVFASSVLWYVSEPETAIHEMIRILKPGGKFVFDVRNPGHIANCLTQLSLQIKKLRNREVLKYSFFTPGTIYNILANLPILFDITGFFILLPTQLPVLGRTSGNWSYLSSWLSFNAGNGWGKWFAQKLLISGEKLIE